jgi:hypothetical protein
MNAEVFDLGSVSLAGRFSCSSCLWQLLFCLLEGFSWCSVLLCLRAERPCDTEAACFTRTRAISWLRYLPRCPPGSTYSPPQP